MALEEAQSLPKAKKRVISQVIDSVIAASGTNHINDKARIAGLVLLSG